MARTETKVIVNNFAGGLVSDFHPLNTPPNTTTDESNCDLDRRGYRKRRLGIDFEPGYVELPTGITQQAFPNQVFRVFTWTAVNESGDTNFLVTQSGNVLAFYDMSFDSLSAGALPFTVDLDNFKIPQYQTTYNYEVSAAPGKGVFFVVGEAINPFYITYTAATNSIATTQITITIRDLDLQDTALGYTDQVLNPTAAQKYDLYNIGWRPDLAVALLGDSEHQAGQGPVLFDYVNNPNAHPVGQLTTGGSTITYPAHVYPPKSKTWWLGMSTDIENGHQIFSQVTLDQAAVGDQLAPLGTFILNAFNQDRSAISGLQGLPVVRPPHMPTSVAFYSGRVWYGYTNKLYFSQIIQDDFSVVGRCYQAADPTAQILNDLVATDGGYLQVLDSSDIISMIPWQNQLFVFSSLGVWALGGSSIGTGFSATDFALYKVSEAGALGARSVVSAEGRPVWWSKLGIYMIAGQEAKQGYDAVNLCEGKLQLYYNSIPSISRTYASGAYDHVKKVLTWVFNSQLDPIAGNPYVCDSMLNFDTIFKAFYPYSVAFVPGNSPVVVDVFDTIDIVATYGFQTVFDNSGNTVYSNDGSAVTSNLVTFGNSTQSFLQSSLKYFTYYLTPLSLTITTGAYNVSPTSEVNMAHS